MTLVTLLGKLYIITKKKKAKKIEKEKKNVLNFIIAFGLPIETFLSNKLTSRVVSKIILIVFVL